MTASFIERVKNALLLAGIGIYRTASNEEIKEVISLLKPVATDKELIRIGGSGDGGYLVPDDLENIRYCFSPGVAETATFEADLAGRGIKSFLADYSVSAPPIESDLFAFDKKFLGALNDEVYFTLGSWVDKYVPGAGDDLILQMDIEGSEYEVLCEVDESLLSRFRILLIEFHTLDKLFDRTFLNLFRVAAGKLSRNFHCVHIHPNNDAGSVKRKDLEIPRLLECTFLRKDRGTVIQKHQTYPHLLDEDNVREKEPLILPPCWR